MLLVMTSWKVILGFEQEEMVDKVDVDLAITIFIMKCYLYYDNYLSLDKVDVDLVEFDHGLDPGIPGLLGSWSDQVEKEEIVS